MASETPFLCKDWYLRELDRLKDLGRAGGGKMEDRPLRYLPAATFADVIQVAFKEYNVRATKFALNLVSKGDLNTAHSFFEAHDDAMEKFGFEPHLRYYRDLARIVSNYRLQKKGLDHNSITPSDVPPLPPFSPSPDPPTPTSILSWIEASKDLSLPAEASCPRPPDDELPMAQEQILDGPAERSQSDNQGDSIAADLSPASAIPKQGTQRRQYSRLAKTKGEQARSATNRRGSGMTSIATIATVEGTTTALHRREVNGNERRSGKRRRSGDDIFSHDKDDASMCKRRRMTSKSK